MPGPPSNGERDASGQTLASMPAQISGHWVPLPVQGVQDSEWIWNPGREGPCPNDCSAHRKLQVAEERNSIPGVKEKAAACACRHLARHTASEQKTLQTALGVNSECLQMGRLKALCKQSRRPRNKERHPSTECHEGHRRGMCWPETLQNKDSRQSGSITCHWLGLLPCPLGRGSRLRKLLSGSLNDANSSDSRVRCQGFSVSSSANLLTTINQSSHLLP